jgi:plasmid replication initiation protein
MASIERDKSAVSVTQDNELIQASYTLTLNEKRLLLLCISKLDPRHFPRTGAECEMTVEEWRERFPQDDTPWRALQRSAKRLLKRHVTFHPRAGVTKDINWFDSVEYVEGEGRIKICFTYSITTRLQGFVEQFTKVNLLEVSRFTSFHTIRLYELISQFRATGYRRISLDDLRLALSCIDSYSETKMLKRWVLNPALKEINEKADFSVECRDTKRGRRIVGFEFIISEKAQGDLFQ